MKNESFKKLWTETSIKRILQDFLKSDHSYICLASVEFNHLWSIPKNRRCLRRRVDKFRPGLTNLTGNCLMYVPVYHEKEVRIQFLKHEIKRLTKKRTGI